MNIELVAHHLTAATVRGALTDLQVLQNVRKCWPPSMSYFFAKDSLSENVPDQDPSIWLPKCVFFISDNYLVLTWCRCCGGQ